jgi:hypothetical protein
MIVVVISFAFRKQKKTFVDLQFLKKICPGVFDSFAFVPSRGALGGMIVAWKSVFFEWSMVF